MVNCLICFSIQTQLESQFTGLIRLGTYQGIDLGLEDFLGCLRRDLLDLNTALDGGHKHNATGLERSTTAPR